MTTEDQSLARSLRASFAKFWNEQLQIEAVGGGFVVAPPLLYADGWQVAVYLESLTPRQWRLSDRGATLGKFVEAGLNVSQDRLASAIDRQAEFYGFAREGLQIEKLTGFPFQAADIQIFAEALVALSHLAPKVPNRSRSAPSL